MRQRTTRRVLTWTAVLLLVGQLGCAARAVPPPDETPAAFVGEADRQTCEAYARKQPSKSVLARVLLGGLVLAPIGVGLGVLGAVAGRPDGLVIAFMAFDPAVAAARDNRATRETALGQCLAPILQARTLGSRHPEVALSLARLADGYVAVGDLTRAEALYREALAIQEEAPGPGDTDLLRTLAGYAAALRKSDRADEAARLEARAEAIRAAGAAAREGLEREILPLPTPATPE